MWLQNITEIGLVAKFDVKAIDRSLAWYETKLGFEPDNRFRTKTWAQLNVPGVNFAAVGLNQNSKGTGSAGAVLTLVVPNIAMARNELIAGGVDVGPIEDAGDGVQLAMFADPDGNSLSLRENSPTMPLPSEIGYQAAHAKR
jgi:catechol 2,3-dioxygenase-like lactoylglutathione lyase family enzyme